MKCDWQVIVNIKHINCPFNVLLHNGYWCIWTKYFHFSDISFLEKKNSNTCIRCLEKENDSWYVKARSFLIQIVLTVVSEWMVSPESCWSITQSSSCLWYIGNHYPMFEPASSLSTLSRHSVCIQFHAGYSHKRLHVVILYTKTTPPREHFFWCGKQYIKEILNIYRRPNYTNIPLQFTIKWLLFPLKNIYNK